MSSRLDEDSRTHSPLAPEAIYVLYHTAVSAQEEADTLLRGFVVLGLARLGLTPDELLHFHEGWVDWRAGVIRVPAHDPCGCKRCLSRVQDRHSISSRAEAGSIAADTQWQPDLDHGARTIPFEWSSRLTAAILTFFDEHTYLEQRDITPMLDRIATESTGLDPADVTPAALRGSAGRTFAEFGYSPEEVARIVGLPHEEAEPIVRRAVPPEQVGTDLDSHLRRYRVVANPNQIGNEPWDPTDIDENALAELANKRETTSRRITNPRPPHPDCPTDPSRDPSNVAVFDADSEILTRDTECVQSLSTALTRRLDHRQAPDELDRPAHLDRTETEQSTSAETLAEQPAAVHASGARTSAGGTGDAADPPASTPEPAPEPQPGEQSGAAATGFVGRRHDEVVTAPRFSRTVEFVSPLITDGQVTAGSIAVDGDRLVFDVTDSPNRQDAAAFAVRADDVVTVAPNHRPSAVQSVFDRSCGIKFEVDGEEAIVVIEPPAGEKRDLLETLFWSVLDGRTVVYTHPAQEGGRVLSETTTRTGTLSVAGDRLVIDPDEDDTEAGHCRIYLRGVTDVDTTLQKRETESVHSVEVQHIPGTQTITTYLGAPSQDVTNPLKQYIRLHYSSLMNTVRSVELSSAEKQLLIGIHSMGDMDARMDALTGMLGMEKAALEERVDGVVEKGLLAREGNGLELTPVGRVAVSEKLDDVNF